MPKELIIALAVYFVIISVLSVITCIYDKLAAKIAKRHRTREATLLLLSALGGSVPMLATMLIIRHKTKHPKFMIGIPLIIIFQVAAAVALHVLIP